MRDFRDAKAMAHALRNALEARAVALTHSDSLELIAKAFGYDNWNILAARIEAAKLRAQEERASTSTKTLYCSFCGKSQHDVAKLITGPAVFICDECVGLCTDIIRDETPIWKVMVLLAEGRRPEATPIRRRSSLPALSRRKRSRPIWNRAGNSSSTTAVSCIISIDCSRGRMRRRPTMILRDRPTSPI